MREIFATIKINETSSPSLFLFFRLPNREKQRMDRSGPRPTPFSSLLLGKDCNNRCDSTFINELFSGWTRIFLITRSPRARRPSIDPDEDGSLLFLTAVAELGYYFTPRYSSSVGVFLKFFSSSRSHARRTIESPS